jgi:hypothetical protein
MNAPERASKTHCTKSGSAEKTHDVDFSHLPIRIAVTPTQLELVKATAALRAMFDEWPTARQIALAADIAFTVTCAELKSLVRVGVVEWTKTVRVVREPDGLFLAAYQVQL